MSYLKPAAGVIILAILIAVLPITSLIIAQIALLLTLPERPDNRQIFYFCVVILSAISLVL